MNDQSSFGAIALTRLQAMQAQHEQKQKQSENNNITSIEVPAAITNLITGSEYWINAKANRYKKLIREGHLNDLLELAGIALAKDKPANWFAKVCSVIAWERTLDFLKKRHVVLEKAEQIGKRIGEGMTKFIYKQLWAGKSVERHAVASQEIGKNKHRLFAWLCKQEEQRTAVKTA